jgi:hypothetical protein
MSPRLSILALFLLVALTPPVPSNGEVFRALVRDFQEINQWPCPYNCWDRESAKAPWAGMIQNGWRRQNLLADGHFTGNNSELSAAGQYKVRWILTEAQIDHRTIFVRRGETAEETAARLNAVRKYAAKVAPDGGPPSILETHLSPAGYPAGWPGAKDESITRKFQSNMPDKLYLPERNSNGGSGN